MPLEARFAQRAGLHKNRRRRPPVGARPEGECPSKPYSPRGLGSYKKPEAPPLPVGARPEGECLSKPDSPRGLGSYKNRRRRPSL